MISQVALRVRILKHLKLTCEARMVHIIIVLREIWSRNLEYYGDEEKLNRTEPKYIFVTNVRKPYSICFD